MSENGPADPNAGDVRDGEVTVTLPAGFDAQLYFIGRIRTPWTSRKDCPHNARESRERGDICTIEVDPRFAAALKDVEGCSHLIVLYWMNNARRDLVQQVPRRATEPRGTFSLRSPVRPNPVALSVVQLIRIEGTTLSVIGLDCMDTTPLIDIKPYFVSTDCVPDAVASNHKKQNEA